MCVCICVYFMSACMCMYMYTCIYTCVIVHVCTCVCTYVCLYSCMSVHVFLHLGNYQLFLLGLSLFSFTFFETLFSWIFCCIHTSAYTVLVFVGGTRSGRHYHREQWLIFFLCVCDLKSSFLKWFSIPCMTLFSTWSVLNYWALQTILNRASTLGVCDDFLQRTYRRDQRGFGVRNLLNLKHNLCVQSINMLLNGGSRFISQKLFLYAVRKPRSTLWSDSPLNIPHNTEQFINSSTL